MDFFPSEFVFFTLFFLWGPTRRDNNTSMYVTFIKDKIAYALEQSQIIISKVDHNLKGNQQILRLNKIDFMIFPFLTGSGFFFKKIPFTVRDVWRIFFRAIRWLWTLYLWGTDFRLNIFPLKAIRGYKSKCIWSLGGLSTTGNYKF